MTDQNGKAVKLSDYAGKTVVLEWFNDGCPYVKKHYSTGSMNATATKYAEKGVVWLAINSTNSADVSHNAEVDKKWKMSRPILDDHAGKVGKLYGATNTPQMFVVDGTGKVVYSGAIDSTNSADSNDIAASTNYVAAALDETIAGKAVTKAETKPYGCTVKYAK
ncbi:MAG: redoxin domain-containing protein [Tepidisphaeraceae bacterium]